MMWHEKSSGLWIKLGMDLVEIDGQTYLLIADYLSRYPIIRKMTNLKGAAMVSMDTILGMLGMLKDIVTDNGPQFLSDFNNYCHKKDIMRTTSSPQCPQSNGFIEWMAQCLKPVVNNVSELVKMSALPY